MQFVENNEQMDSGATQLGNVPPIIFVQFTTCELIGQKNAIDKHTRLKYERVVYIECTHFVEDIFFYCSWLKTYDLLK